MSLDPGDLSADLALEVEALRCIYGDEMETIVDASSGGAAALRIAVKAYPHAGDALDSCRFVQATLMLSPGVGYPACPPRAWLEEARGLGEARLAAIAERLASEAAELAGEPALGHLCQVARDAMDDFNTPEGALNME
jgi:hypothetical protein